MTLRRGMKRRDVARTVNAALVVLYWNVGRRIRQDILKEKRARLLPEAKSGNE